MDGMFPKSVKLILCIHLGKEPYKTCAEGEKFKSDFFLLPIKLFGNSVRLPVGDT